MLAQRAAAAFGTPCYLSRWRPVARMVCDAGARVRRSRDAVVAFVQDASGPPARREWMRSGRGVEVVSEAELVTVRGAGLPDGRNYWSTASPSTRG